MASTLDTLRELHDYHTELTQVREKLRLAPLELQQRRNELARLETALQAAQAALKTLRVRTDQKELSLKSGEQKLRDLRVKLNMIKTTREYASLQEDIRQLDVANQALETEVLEMFTEQETKAKEIQQAGQDLVGDRQRFADFGERNRYTVEKLTSRVALLEGKIAECEARLDPETRDLYLRLVKLKGAAALAPCHDGSCGGCFTAVTPQAMDLLAMGKVVRCHSCGTMLYLG